LYAALEPGAVAQRCLADVGGARRASAAAGPGARQAGGRRGQCV